MYLQGASCFTGLCTCAVWWCLHLLLCYSRTSIFISAVLKVMVSSISLNQSVLTLFSHINRASASWRQPFCTSSSWHRSAGSSQRPGSPTWRWQERFAPGSSASAFCVSAGVSKLCVLLHLFIISHHTSLLPFSLKVSGQGVFPSTCTSFFFFFKIRRSHPLCGAARSSSCQALCCDAFVFQSSSLRAG